MYFAILGTFTEICLEELQLIEPKNLVIKQGVAFFDSYSWSIEKLSGIIKRGEVATEDALYKYFTNTVLLWSNSEVFAKFIKSSGRVRRWKHLKDIRSSDLELKKAWGVELLEIDGKYCVVLGYQDIEHYEQIDFGKASSGMEIGMMPSKLAQMMVNIGMVESNKKQVTSNQQPTTDNWQPATIYDPFCWFGTTGFVVNWLGHHFIGSDINITPCKENVKRRKNWIWQRFDRFFTVFKHDVLEPFDSKKMLDNVDVIVSEWWLGPVIKNFHQREIRKPDIMKKVSDVYIGFLRNYAQRFQEKKVPIVITIPVYQIDGSSIEQDLIVFCKELGLHFRSIEQIYVRKGQNVGRKICIIWN